MKSSGGLRRRLARAFLLQALLISAVAVIGVYAAAFTIEEVLIKRALEEEAGYFWQRRRADPGFPLPDTRNLTGLLAGAAERGRLPGPLTGLELGFHKLPTQADFSVVYVTESAGERLYLVFDGERVGELSLYFGLVPLAGVLVVLYLAAWLGYRASRRAISPVVWLAREVHRLDPQAIDPRGPARAAFDPAELPGKPDAEVLALAEALSRLSQRIAEFVERERNFTRDASHELRSPLTVIRIAADMLLSEQELGRPASNSVLRIKRAAADMEELTEAFLLLARESDQALSKDPVCVNDVVAEELERARLLVGEKPIEVEAGADCRLVTRASEKVLSVLVGNLVRNALGYTDAGRVRVHVGAGTLTIEDSGVGMKVEEVLKPFVRGRDAPRGGYGVGLTIVRRLSDRFGWPVSIQSEVGVGTRVVVRFPDSWSEGFGSEDSGSEDSGSEDSGSEDSGPGSRPDSPSASSPAAGRARGRRA